MNSTFQMYFTYQFNTIDNQILCWEILWSLFFYIRERNDWECSGKYFFVVGDASDDDDDDDGKPSKTNTIYMYHIIIYCLYFYLSNEVYG